MLHDPRIPLNKQAATHIRRVKTSRALSG